MKKNPLIVMLIALVVITTAAPAFVSSLDERKVAPADTITTAELRDHMYYLASEELRGRETGTPDYMIAANYCSAEFREAGLVPALKDEQGHDTFLQKVPLARTAFGENNRLVFTSESKTTDLTFSHDYFLLPSPHAKSVKLETELLFLGYGISEPENGWDDYQGVDVSGKAVIFALGAPQKDGKPVLPDKLNESYSSSFRSISLKIRTAADKGAVLAVIIPDSQLAENWDRFMPYLSRPRMTSVPDKEQEVNEIPEIVVNVNTLKTVFGEGTLDPSNRKAIGKIKNGYELSTDIDIQRTSITSFNVVAKVPGTDPALKDEVVTIGAHLDHVGVQNGEVYPGADDNASGVVSALEVGEALAMSPLRRTVMIVLYTGEEKGLLGSGYFVQHSPVPLDKIIANINMDMVGRYDVNSKDANILFAVGSDMICKRFKAIIEQVDGDTLKLPLEYSDPHDYFPRSDQVQFHRAGIPAVFITIDDHIDYHKPTDTADKICYDNMRKIAQLVYYLTQELANMDEQLCANERK